MRLFNRKKNTEPPVLKDPQEREAQIEIVAHKDAKKEIVDEAEKVNKHLKELLVQNGFTLKIYLAAQSPRPKTNPKGGK